MHIRNSVRLFYIFWGERSMANDSKLRLLRILELLKEKTDENHPLSTSEMKLTLVDREPGK